MRYEVFTQTLNDMDSGYGQGPVYVAEAMDKREAADIMRAERCADPQQAIYCIDEKGLKFVLSLDGEYLESLASPSHLHKSHH